MYFAGCISILERAKKTQESPKKSLDVERFHEIGIDVQGKNPELYQF